MPDVRVPYLTACWILLTCLPADLIPMVRMCTPPVSQPRAAVYKPAQFPASSRQYLYKAPFFKLHHPGIGGCANSCIAVPCCALACARQCCPPAAPPRPGRSRQRRGEILVHLLGATRILRAVSLQVHHPCPAFAVIPNSSHPLARCTAVGTCGLVSRACDKPTGKLPDLGSGC